jgi:hypothetical protein
MALPPKQKFGRARISQRGLFSSIRRQCCRQHQRKIPQCPTATLKLPKIRTTLIAASCLITKSTSSIAWRLRFDHRKPPCSTRERRRCRKSRTPVTNVARIPLPSAIPAAKALKSRVPILDETSHARTVVGSQPSPTRRQALTRFLSETRLPCSVDEGLERCLKVLTNLSMKRCAPARTRPRSSRS